DAATAQRLIDVLGANEASVLSNPVDVTLAGLRSDILRGAIAALLDSPSYDAVAVVAGASAIARPNLAADAAAACLRQSDKPLLAYVSPHAPEVIRAFNAQGIPATATPESCAAMLAALARSIPDHDIAPAAPCMPAALISVGAGPLNEAESKELFA